MVKVIGSVITDSLIELDNPNTDQFLSLLEQLVTSRGGLLIVKHPNRQLIIRGNIKEQKRYLVMFYDLDGHLFRNVMVDSNHALDDDCTWSSSDPDLPEIVVRSAVSIETVHQVGLHFFEFGYVPRGLNWELDMSKYES